MDTGCTVAVQPIAATSLINSGLTPALLHLQCWISVTVAQIFGLCYHGHAVLAIRKQHRPLADLAGLSSK